MAIPQSPAYSVVPWLDWSHIFGVSIIIINLHEQSLVLKQKSFSQTIRHQAPKLLQLSIPRDYDGDTRPLLSLRTPMSSG